MIPYTYTTLQIHTHYYLPDLIPMQRLNTQAFRCYLQQQEELSLPKYYLLNITHFIIDMFELPKLLALGLLV